MQLETTGTFAGGNPPRSTEERGWRSARGQQADNGSPWNPDALVGHACTGDEQAEDSLPEPGDRTGLAPEVARRAVNARKGSVVGGGDLAIVLRAVVQGDGGRAIDVMAVGGVQQRPGRHDQQYGGEQSRHGSVPSGGPA
jgi:hypothetical protein